MRTTLTLDPDTVLLLEEEVHRTRLPLKRVVNDAIRRALSPAPQEPYRVAVHTCHLVGSRDVRGYNRLADALEDSAFLAAEPERR